MNTFPDNFDRLTEGENTNREKSKQVIRASDDLSLHTRMIERSLTMINHAAHNGPSETDDDRTILMLFARLFNSGAGAMQMLLSGYYQNAVMIMRDILETTFLIDYLQHKPEEISVWRTCDEKKRTREFGAFKIRTALDDRDGYTTRKREDAYQLLCKLGSHPTYVGFQVMMPRGSNLAIVGPFFDPSSLEAVLSELAKTIVQAGGKARHPPERDLDDYKLTIEFLTIQADWLDRFFNANTDRKPIERIAATVAEIERRGGLPKARKP